MDVINYDDYRDEDGFIRLVRKTSDKVKVESITPELPKYNRTETQEIILRHGHIAITNYKKGDCWELEKALSVWDKVSFKYRMVAGWFVEEYEELRLSRGYDLRLLARLLPNRKFRVENYPTKPEKIDIDLYAEPRNDFQKVALTFMTCQGSYTMNNKYTQQLIDADTGDGKAQPNDTMIPTPKGLRRLDSLKVGDKVFNLDGKPVKILNIYPQKGLQKTYEVIFKDGRSTRCNDEHLWYVFDKYGRSEVLPLSEIRKNYLMPSKDGKHMGHRYSIPLPGPIQYKEYELPIDPYLIGAFIGNGALGESALTFTSGNTNVTAEVSRRVGYPTHMRRYDNYSFRFITHQTIDYDMEPRYWYLQTDKFFEELPEMINCKSATKFIPDIYKYNSIENRWLLLQGLFDTDGHISKDKYKISYTTISERLKNDIVEIIQSLGMAAYVTMDTRDKYKTGVCYRIIVACPDILKPKFFKANIKSLKRANYASNNYKTRKRDGLLAIYDIKEVEATEQRCIYIDDPRHVYVTEKYLTTHNTYCGVASIAYWQHKAVIIVPLSKLLDQWKKTLIDFTSVKESEIMIVQGSSACEKILSGKCKDIKVFIFMVDTIASFQKKNGNVKTIELLDATHAYIKIVDEVHRDMKAISMIDALSNFRLNYYMSASPGRAEQKENWIFRTLFKNVPRFGSTFKTEEERHINIMIKKYFWTPDHMQIKAMVNPRTGLNTKAYERELINSTAQQRESFDTSIKVMLNWAKGVLKNTNKILILAQSIETLYYLQKLAEEVFPGETSVYYGGLKPKEKEAALKYKVIVATSSTLGTGADIKGLQFCFNTSTYANQIEAIQISGRTRKIEGTEVVYCELVNFGYLKTARQFEKRRPALLKRAKHGKLIFVN